MYRLKDIQKKLAHVVGWRKPYDTRFTIIEELTETESGLYFQGAHPLMTLENMFSIMPDTYGAQFRDYSEFQDYKTGDVVTHLKNSDGSFRYWQAIAPSTGMNPPSSPEAWRETTPLSLFLQELTDDGIAKAIQTFAREKQLEKETRAIMERKAFFDGAGRIQATVQNRHKIVGFEIVPLRAMGVTSTFEKIGLQMTGATGRIRLYLFHSSQPEPVRVFNLDFTAKNGGFQWFPIDDCHLPYIADGNDAGGAWYLCYNQDELPMGMEAINVSKDWSREPCGTCNTGNIEVWRTLTKYMQVSPFMVDVPEGFLEYPVLWDVSRMMYTNTANYGLNCSVSIGCDLTDFIVSQRHIFQTAIQLQVAAIGLRMLAMNPSVRVNRNQSNVTRMDILYEIDGNTNAPRPGGLGYELREAYKAIQLDTQGLDRACLGCNNRGVKYRTV